jgi:hypothetical protein
MADDEAPDAPDEAWTPEDAAQIPISALQHYAYCPRQCALISPAAVRRRHASPVARSVQLPAIAPLCPRPQRHRRRSAVEAAGLDPQAGFLHGIRPGRPGLALDLLEEFRPLLADRLAFTLMNRRQIGPAAFETRPGGAVSLTEAGRKAVIAAYHRRKQEELGHPELKKRTPLGLVPTLAG